MLAIVIKTLSTIIGLQFFGNSFDNFFVVMQKDALVLDATSSYFLNEEMK